MLAAAAEALDQAAANHEVELFIVDNGSTDNTREVVGKLAPANLSVAYLSEPIAGVCRAKNRGIRSATGDVLVFTDDDCRVASDYFTDLAAHYASDAGPVIRGGRVELGDPTDAAITIKLDEEPATLRDGQHPGGFIHGCNLTMSREVLDRVGLWDERFGPGAEFIAAEDTEFSYRAHKAGIPVHYVPDMTTRHLHGRKTFADVAKLTQQYQRGNGALLGKYTDKTLLVHLYWYLRNWIREPLGGPKFNDELNLSHRELVAGQVIGALSYWRASFRRRSKTSN